MDNENKEIELETQDMEPDVENEVTEDIAEETVEETTEEAVNETVEETAEEAAEEFDPTESEDFYNNLEAAIGTEADFEETELPELSLPEDTFVLDSIAEQPEEQSVDEDIFAGVDAALSEQIEQEFGVETQASATEEKKPNRFVAVWKAIPTWTKVLVSIILVLLLSVGLLFGTKAGRKFVTNLAIEWAFRNVKVDEENPTPVPELTGTVTPTPAENQGQTPVPTTDPNQNTDVTPNPTQNPDVTPEATPDVTLAPTFTPTPTPAITIMDDDRIINILLLGEENIYHANRGRTDAIIVVSVNLDGGPLKMISFQRDLYVSIPGHRSNRINAAYVKGNFKCAVETIEQNFGIDIDGYAKVDFEGFENLIDKLGGLRISLTAKESEFLNTTTYISKPGERNTVAGYQNMTGSQVLGYCRVRQVATASGLRDDRGRNYRHRVVLEALFEKFKSKNPTQLVSLMNECLSYVTVSGNLEDLAKKCVVEIVENKMFEIDTMQIPQSGMYEGQSIPDETGKNMDVIVFFPSNVEKLQKFIYE